MTPCQPWQAQCQGKLSFSNLGLRSAVGLVCSEAFRRRTALARGFIMFVYPSGVDGSISALCMLTISAFP